MKPVRVLDVAALPTYAYGNASMMWWATLCLVLIEGMVFAIAIAVYFYLRTLPDAWPPFQPPPDLFWGTLNTGILLASGIPNHLAKKSATQEDVRGSRLWLLVSLLFALAFLTVRGFEYRSLNAQWFDSAYGSIVFALLTLHTAHLITDFIDSVVLAVLLFTGPREGRRFVDVAENAAYWWFVVLAWVPIYFTIYWAPRL